MAIFHRLVHDLCMKSENTEDKALDSYDISLLAALQRNGHATHQQLGEQVHLSASQVSRRVQRLQAAGYIQRFVALLNPAAVGLGVRAVSYVALTRNSGNDTVKSPIGLFDDELIDNDLAAVDSAIFQYYNLPQAA